MEPNPTPTIGRIVHYQTDERGGKHYTLPAIVTCVAESHPNGDEERVHEHFDNGAEQSHVADNPVPVPNTYAGYVHLHVLTPGPQQSYTELTVPFDPEGSPRSWRWPERTS